MHNELTAMGGVRGHGTLAVPAVERRSSERADAQRRFWAYAAAFGAAWGSLEIVIGSFLHSLRVPFTGPLLAATGAALLVAERQLLSLRGLSLATGAVAAACKSLSPGGVILGPMIGISIEAALVELCLLSSDRNWGSTALAGALAALFATSQGVLTQTLLYGGDILSLYVAAIRRSSAWLGANESTGFAVLGLVVALLVLLGALGGMLGRRTGEACREHLSAGGELR